MRTKLFLIEAIMLRTKYLDFGIEWPMGVVMPINQINQPTVSALMAHMSVKTPINQEKGFSVETDQSIVGRSEYLMFQYHAYNKRF